MPDSLNVHTQHSLTDDSMPPMDVQLRPAPPVRWIGKAQMRLIAHAPRTWRFFRWPTRLFFNLLADRWDTLFRPEAPAHIAPLLAAIEQIKRDPKTILDIGTGTGAAALALARRFSSSQVSGIDISERMVARARERVPGDLVGRVRFSVGDAVSLSFNDSSFDLVTQVSAPVFFDEVVRIMKPASHVIVVSTLGKQTPYHLPDSIVRRGFERRGLRTIASGSAGRGTFIVAQRPQ